MPASVKDKTLANALLAVLLGLIFLFTLSGRTADSAFLVRLQSTEDCA